MPPTAYLHIGLPKTGTTFLQTAILRQRRALGETGVQIPARNATAMFHASIDVRGTHQAWGVSQEQVAGVWAEQCAQARAHPGASILGHELFCQADSDQIAAALAELHDVETHLVVTTRDLARQIASEWQEGVKQGRRVSFTGYRRRLFGPQSRAGARFWQAQDLGAVLDRWGAFFPPERVHVICGPRPGAPRDTLWRHFAAVVGFDPDQIPVVGDARGDNPSLGTTEIALMRRVNVALDGRLVMPEYGRVVKRYFARRVLNQRSSPRVECPADMHDELLPLAQGWVDQIREAGYDVRGELEDLLPVRTSPETPHPDSPTVEEQLESAAFGIAELLVEIDRRNHRRPGKQRRGGPAGPGDRGRRLVRGMVRRLARPATRERRSPGGTGRA